MEGADNLKSGCCSRGSVGTILHDGVHGRYLVIGDVNGDGVVGGWLRRVTEWKILGVAGKCET